MELNTIFNAITALATFGGFIVVIYQLRQNSKLEQSKFEYDITKRFIDITNELKFDTIYLSKEKDSDFGKHIKNKLHEFYQYFDLTNQEIYLKNKNKITDETWDEWEEGIIYLLKRDSFMYAWELIDKTVTEATFNELREYRKKKHIDKV